MANNTLLDDSAYSKAIIASNKLYNFLDIGDRNYATKNIK